MKIKSICDFSSVNEIFFAVIAVTSIFEPKSEKFIQIDKIGKYIKPLHTYILITFQFWKTMKNWPFLVVFEKKKNQTKIFISFELFTRKCQEKSLKWILNSISKKSFMTSNWCCKFIKQISQKCEQTHVQTYVYFGKNRKKNIQKVVRFNCCIKMSVHVFYCIKHL